MPETHDFGKSRFITTVRYPPVPQLPFAEYGVETHETEEPFRRGFGWVARIPFTRLGIVIGSWIDEGGPEDERLRQALQSSELPATTDAISEW